MGMPRALLFSVLFLCSMSLNAVKHEYVVYDHQFNNFLKQRCQFDLDAKWKSIFKKAVFDGGNQLTDLQKRSLSRLQVDMMSAVMAHLYTDLAYSEAFRFFADELDKLLTPRMPELPGIQDQIQQQLMLINAAVCERADRHDGGGTYCHMSVKNYNKREFLERLFNLIVDFFDPRSIQVRLTNDRSGGALVKKSPLVTILISYDDEKESMETKSFPTETFINGDQILDCPHILYDDESAQSQSWVIKACGYGLLALLVGAGIYENRVAISEKAHDVKDALWNPNQCDVHLFAGPTCINAWQIRCKNQEYSINDKIDFSCINASKNDGSSLLPIILCNGKNLAFVGDVTPGAWHCSVGKKGFHFLPDGRLCFQNLPVIREGVEKPFCDRDKLYCDLPDGLRLYRHGNDMLLTPPCGNGVKICTVDDLKFYLHEDGSYKETSPCADGEHSEAVCIFDENIIEFWNYQEKKWQNKPVNWAANKKLYRFIKSDQSGVLVFCNKDGSCSVKFPCQPREGICIVDGTEFFRKKDASSWTEGMPCDAYSDKYCVLENDAVYYPHIKNGTSSWEDTPAWDWSVSHQGVFKGPDGRIFIPNDDCTGWVRLEDASKCMIQGTTLSYCTKDGKVKYWKNMGNGCWWSDIPSCDDFADLNYCVGVDGTLFQRNVAGYFVELKEPADVTKSRLVDFDDGRNYATWDPEQKKWLINDAPLACEKANRGGLLMRLTGQTKGYCTLDDGNRLYAGTLDGKTLWLLNLDVAPDVRLIRFGDGAYFWFGNDGWKPADLCGDKSSVPYCRQSDEKTILYRHGNKWSLEPSCEKDSVLCRVGDLKLYLRSDGTYSEVSPCGVGVSGEVCDLGGVLEFWSAANQQWQNTPEDWNDQQVLYRFVNKAGKKINVFCDENGHCSLNPPCDLSAGICEVDTRTDYATTFYSKKDSGVWTEGMPCTLEEADCMLQNGRIFYRHFEDGVLSWQDVPYWDEESSEVCAGKFVGKDGKIFIPNDNANAWVSLSGSDCFFDNAGNLAYCDLNGDVYYWHSDCDDYGWYDAPMCTGNERDGMCMGPDGRVFILNDDLTEWVLMSDDCNNDSALFCINEDSDAENNAVKYWHRGESEDETGRWANVPDCKDFAGQEYCLGPDNRLFKLNEQASQFELFSPTDVAKSQLVTWNDGARFATWDPAQHMWLLNTAPASCELADHDCCSLDDGNELFANKDKTAWALAPHAEANVDVFKCEDGTRRWRQLPHRSSLWTNVMPCLDSDKSFTVSPELYARAAQMQDENGRAKVLVDEDTCKNVRVANLHETCDNCQVKE